MPFFQVKQHSQRAEYVGTYQQVAQLLPCSLYRTLLNLLPELLGYSLHIQCDLGLQTK